MGEFVPKYVASLTLIATLGLTACGGEGSTHNAQPTQQRTAKPANYLPKAEVRYFSNGMRLVEVEDVNGTTLTNGASGWYFQNVLQWCENGDLLEETDSTNGTSSIERTGDFAGCIDGRLTPSDFPNNPSETS